MPLSTPRNEFQTRYWAVVPAAGSGARMGAALPKQYLPLSGKTVLEHTLNRLCAHPRINSVVVVVAPHDHHWQRLHLNCGEKLLAVAGGAERCHSVLSGLLKLKEIAGPRDWVLVHDAARPCVRAADIDRLTEELAHHPVGGILALPMADTVKRADEAGNILQTVSREGLWRALTPQMFRLGDLTGALQLAISCGVMVTDEAAAMEQAGFVPRVVAGRADNIKITLPQDLALAELYLKQQEAGL